MAVCDGNVEDTKSMLARSDVLRFVNLPGNNRHPDTKPFCRCPVCERESTVRDPPSIASISLASSIMPAFLSARCVASLQEIDSRSVAVVSFPCPSPLPQWANGNALHTAINRKDAALARAVLAAGASPGVVLKPHTAQTPLFVAAAVVGDEECVRALLDAGADPNTAAIDSELGGPVRSTGPASWPARCGVRSRLRVCSAWWRRLLLPSAQKKEATTQALRSPPPWSARPGGVGRPGALLRFAPRPRGLRLGAAAHGGGPPADGHEHGPRVQQLGALQ